MVGLGRMGILLNRGSSSSSAQAGSGSYTSAPSASVENNNTSNSSNGFHYKDRSVSTSQPFRSAHHLTAETVAALPPPGQTSPSSFAFSPGSRYLSFFSSSHGNALPPLKTHNKIVSRRAASSSNSVKSRSGSVNVSTEPIQSMGERKLCGIDVSPYLPPSKACNGSDLRGGLSAENNTSNPLPKKDCIFSHDQVFSLLDSTSLESAENNGDSQLSLEERLRRERQRLHATGVTQFSWSTFSPTSSLSDDLVHSNMEIDDNDDDSSLLGELMCTSMKGTTEVVLKESNSLHHSNHRNEIETSDRYYEHESKLNEEKSRLRESKMPNDDNLRILIPLRGNIYVQDGIGALLRLVYDKNYSINLMHDKFNGEHANNVSDNHSNSHRSRKTTRNNGSAVGRDDGAIDPQLSPDGSMIAFVVAGEIYVVDASNPRQRNRNGMDWDGHPSSPHKDVERNVPIPIRLTFGANQNTDVVGDQVDNEDTCITHGLADFVAQEEMDRYRGFWWNPTSDGIVFARVDESHVPPYRISHQGRDGTGSSTFEDHRYPFAGDHNPKVTLGFVNVSRNIVHEGNVLLAKNQWETGKYLKWLNAPLKASEYLARVCFLPDGSICAQWENRAQTSLILVRIDTNTWESSILLNETSNVWINLHHMFRLLPSPISPLDTSANDRENNELPSGSFSFLFASERTGYSHLYLYTYIGGSNEEAILIRAVSGGEWIVESILGVDMEKNLVYVMGTYDSPLERHLYSLPLTLNPTDSSRDIGDMESISSLNGSSGSGRNRIKAVINSLTGNLDTSSSSSSIIRPPDPVRLTAESGMHSIVMDRFCQILVDTSSDLKRPTSVKVYAVQKNSLKLLFVLHDNSNVIRNTVGGAVNNYTSPELIKFKTSDQSEDLYAALYLPDPKVSKKNIQGHVRMTKNLSRPYLNCIQTDIYINLSFLRFMGLGLIH